MGAEEAALSVQAAALVAAIKARIGRKQIFVYLNSAFTPRYDETVAKLFKWHGVEGKLVVNYATVPAWG